MGHHHHNESPPRDRDSFGRDVELKALAKLSSSSSSGGGGSSKEGESSRGFRGGRSASPESGRGRKRRRIWWDRDSDDGSISSDGNSSDKTRCLHKSQRTERVAALRR